MHATSQLLELTHKPILTIYDIGLVFMSASNRRRYGQGSGQTLSIPKFLRVRTLLSNCITVRKLDCPENYLYRWLEKRAMVQWQVWRPSRKLGNSSSHHLSHMPKYSTSAFRIFGKSQGGSTRSRVHDLFRTRNSASRWQLPPFLR